MSVQAPQSPSGRSTCPQTVHGRTSRSSGSCGALGASGSVFKVGDLVRVRMAHRAPKNGIVIKIHADDDPGLVVVRPQDSSRDIYCDPLDVRVLNANR